MSQPDLWLTWLDANTRERLAITRRIADESAAYLEQQPPDKLALVTLPALMFIWIVDALDEVVTARNTKPLRRSRSRKPPAAPAESTPGQ